MPVAGWVIATGNVFGVYLGVVVAGPYSGAHINPALTIALAMHHVFAWSKVPATSSPRWPVASAVVW